MTTRVIILGAGGFIGQALYRHFTAMSAYEVTAYSSRECDLLSLPNIEACLSDLTGDDVVIFAAAVTRLTENSLDSMMSNICMVDNVAHAVLKNGVGQLIFFSTVDVYGIVGQDTTINEQLLPRPNDYYAFSKLIGEFILQKACTDSRTPLFILRLSGIYGPGDQGKSTLWRLVESAMSWREVVLYGDGANKRDFVRIDDVCRLVEDGIKKKTDMLLNVASGRSFSITEIVEAIRGCGLEFTVIRKPEEANAEKRVKDIIFDVSLLKSAFPEINIRDIREGLPTYIEGLSKGDKNGTRN
jgi:nucleoside-diphosphate-sugar epimerase